MKKLLSSLSLSTPLFLMNAAQSFAQTPGESLNPCNNKSQILSVLCKTRDLGAVIGFIVTIAFIIAILVALIYLIWGGIKWITSGGDKANVETARNQIIAAIIGLLIVFLAFFILNLILGLFGLNLFDLTLPKFPGA